MFDETKTAPLMRGDAQEGVGVLTPSDYGVNITLTIHGTVRPDIIYSGGVTASKTVIEKITPLKILLNELEQGYEVLKSIPVAIREVEGSFVASFSTANINSSGDTWDEAVENLRALIPHLFDLLLSHRPDALGSAPRNQLSVLRSFVKRTGDAQ